MYSPTTPTRRQSVLCSNCSQRIKPIVAVDIDGTLGDYHSHFLRFANTYLGAGDSLERLLEGSLHMYDGSVRFSEYCCALFDIELGEYREVKLAYRQGGMKRSMPIIPGAVALCHQIREADAELWLTTTRPYLSLDGVIKDTLFWLDHHDIFFDGLLFDDDKYRVLADRIDSERVVAVLDDVDEMYDAAGQILYWGWDVPILYMNNFNSAMEAQRNAVYTLDEAWIAIKPRIQQWKEKYHGASATHA
jgi:phosphoglycolate phosphatase-like HAD superfamily hydrolase